MTLIRLATEADAQSGIDTLRRSISELCVADHHGRPKEVEEWLSNKTIDAWRSWIERDDAVVLVAELDWKIVGVGMATFNGDILLNYVHPSTRFMGISNAILASLEKALKCEGVKCCRLESTITAQKFYESRGFLSREEAPLTLSKLL